MFKTILKQVKQYKTASLLTPLWTTLEVVMGVLIPYVTASIIDKGIGAGSLPDVYRYGAMMVGIACLSLIFGILAGRFAAYSSTGLAANLRLAMYRNIQRFSFSDIDKFSTAGLVTRMTTDVSSIQNAFQMLLRTSFRAPLNMISALGMCFLIHKKLSIIFLVAMVILSVFLSVLITRAAKLFKRILLQVDSLNGVVQENVDAIRVVKAFVREPHRQCLRHCPELVGRAFHRGGESHHRRAYVPVQLYHDGPEFAHDAVHDLRPAHPERGECRPYCGSD